MAMGKHGHVHMNNARYVLNCYLERFQQFIFTFCQARDL